MMQIGTVELGSVPRVVGVLGKIKEDLENARKLKIDLVEFRVDKLSERSPENVREVLDEIVSYGFYAIVTVRPSWEGGDFDGSEDERLKLFEVAVGHPGTGAVDVELRSSILDAVRDMAKKAGKVFIVSYHDFEKTPPEEEIRDIMERMKGSGADIAKIAFMGKSVNDAVRVCCALSRFEYPKVFMVMGDAGMFTRVLGFYFGSLMTYTFFSEPSAPGQIGAERLVKLLCDLYPEYSAEKKCSERFDPAIR